MVLSRVGSLSRRRIINKERSRASSCYKASPHLHPALLLLLCLFFSFPTHNENTPKDLLLLLFAIGMLSIDAMEYKKKERSLYTLAR
jgi:hypothetical protein